MLKIKENIDLILICFAILVPIPSGAFLYYYDFPKKIDMEYPAYEYSDEEQEVGEVTSVSVKGKIKRPLFRKSEFEGSIFIEKYEITKDYPDEAWIDMDFFVGNMNYIKFENNKIVTKFFGWLMTEENLASMLIYVDPYPERGNKSAFLNTKIAVPATNYEEATAVEQRLYNLHK
ncbi:MULTISPECIES: hypothetical protein [Bacillus]|uniref:hypothetical protein n=1 Tax=Bacillus TaxID=1386 RepID=UPI000BB78758|nr:MULTISPECIES: hypothetical protein [Bacillus]